VNLARLALRNVLAGRPRAWPALLAVAAAVCVLGLAAGRIAGEQARALSPAHAQAWALALRCVLAAVLAVVAAAVTATAALQGVARRRELATLRALGLRKRDLVLLLELEALWITCIGMLLGLAAGGLMAWVANRAAIAWQGGPEEGVPLLLAPAMDAVFSSLALLLGTAVLAALVPAVGAARQDVARGLDVLPAHPEY
jgi:predicted lysophospholipase L1 biosynthesis ABC-type transport system permease subunit